MRDEQRRKAKAAQDAAAWHARLGAASVSTDAITAFFEWRRDPLNDAAYREVERIWTLAQGLETRPVIQSAIHGAMGRKSRRRRRRLWTGGAGLVSASLLAAVSVGIWLHGRDTYSTEVGATQVIHLADGSAVRLDTASRVTVRYRGDQRLVELNEGRAMFEVAHDGGRPFIVRSGDTDIRAVGTVFDVRRAGGKVTVSMVEGVVEVSDRQRDATPKRVRAGQQIQISATARRVAPIDPAVETGWTHNRLEFRNMALGAAVAEVNRYVKDPVVLAANVSSSQPVSGVFRTGDRDAFTAAAAVLLNLTAVPQPDGAVRLEADKNNRRVIAESPS